MSHATGFGAFRAGSSLKVSNSNTFAMIIIASPTGENSFGIEHNLTHFQRLLQKI